MEVSGCILMSARVQIPLGDAPKPPIVRDRVPAPHLYQLAPRPLISHPHRPEDKAEKLPEFYSSASRDWCRPRRPVNLIASLADTNTHNVIATLPKRQTSPALGPVEPHQVGWEPGT